MGLGNHGNHGKIKGQQEEGKGEYKDDRKRKRKEEKKEEEALE